MSKIFANGAWHNITMKNEIFMLQLKNLNYSKSNLFANISSQFRWKQSKRARTAIISRYVQLQRMAFNFAFELQESDRNHYFRVKLCDAYQCLHTFNLNFTPSTIQLYFNIDSYSCLKRELSDFYDAIYIYHASYALILHNLLIFQTNLVFSWLCCCSE